MMSSFRHVALFLFGSIVAVASVCGQSTIFVDQSNPNCPGSGTRSDPFCTIRDGMNAAWNGDVVLVMPGVYVEQLTFYGARITVRSQGGPAVTVIDGNGAGSVITFAHGEGRDSVLEGFTIRGGTGTFSQPWVYGGGIYCSRTSPTIRDNIIEYNTAESGAAISCRSQSSPLIEGNVIRNNDCVGRQTSGGGIFCYFHSAPTIRRNLIVANSAHIGAGIASFYNTSPTIESNVIALNRALGSTWSAGGGIHCGGATPVIINNTLYGNSSSEHGGGIHLYDAHPTITSCIVWGNTARVSGDQISLRNGSQPSVEYSTIQGGWSGTNFSSNPRFVDPSNGDYDLRANSPCIDAGHPSQVPGGLAMEGHPRVLDGDLDRGMQIDIGAYEFSNIHLAMTGSPTPSGQLTFSATGTSGLPFVRILGTRGSVTSIAPLGVVLFDLSLYWTVVHAAQLPDQWMVAIPGTLPLPLDLVFQDIVLDPTILAGNTSNAVTLSIR